MAAFLKATLKAMNEIAATPALGVEAALQAVPDLAKNRPAQVAILAATIASWRAPGAAAGSPLTGTIDTAAWDQSVAFMTKLKLVAKPVTSADLVDTSFTAGK